MSPSIAPQLNSPYHLVHYGVLTWFFSYWYPHVLRRQALETELGQDRLLSTGYSGCCHEVEVILLMGLAFVWRLRYCRNFDEFWHRVLLHAKIVSLLLTFLSGNRVALLTLMGIYLSMLVMLVPPKYSGDTRVEEWQSEAEFSRQIRHSSADPNVSFLILCYTPWSDACHFFEPVFSELSVEYSNENLQFRSINLDTAPTLANDLEIDVTTRSKQLPSVLLYSRRKLIRRLPPFLDDGKVATTTLDKKGVIKYFELSVNPPNASVRNDTTRASRKQAGKKKRR